MKSHESFRLAYTVFTLAYSIDQGQAQAQGQAL